jgi:Ribonuclease HII
MLPPDFSHPLLNDSKQMTEKQRDLLRQVIEKESIAWAVASVSAAEIDRFNILRASFMAMHRALDALAVKPELVIVDGNRFAPHPQIPHRCFVKGDALFASIAAASVLAKTHRDEAMLRYHAEFPQYHWDQNKGYPTAAHRRAIQEHGPSPLHRKSFRVTLNVEGKAGQ